MDFEQEVSSHGILSLSELVFVDIVKHDSAKQSRGVGNRSTTT